MDDIVPDGSLDVPIVCSACDTRTRVALADARSAVHRHNDRLHDGVATATIDPVIKDELARLVADDLDLL